MLLNCDAWKESWESPGLQGDQTSQSWRKSILIIHCKDWCWSSNTLATWFEELTHWKRPWCWERLKRQEEKGKTEDEMVGQNHWLNGCEFEQTPGDGEGRGSLMCCSPCSCKEPDMTLWLNNKALQSNKSLQDRDCRALNRALGSWAGSPVSPSVGTPALGFPVLI